VDGGSGSDSSLVDEDSSELDCVAELDSEDDDDSHHGIDEDVSLDELVDSQSHGEVALDSEDDVVSSDEEDGSCHCIGSVSLDDDDSTGIHHGMDEDVSLDELVDSQSHGEVALAEERYGSENADDVDEDDG